MKQLFLLIIAGLVLLLATTKSFADEYHGEYCWQVFSDSGEPYWRYNLGIYEKQGGHFALYGSIDYGPNGISAAHGSAVVVGNRIKLTINSADYEEGIEVWAETFAAKLNSSTLDGTWEALTLEIFDDENEVSPVHQHGSIVLTTC